MSKMIQIRNVPDAIHRKLKVRAAELGMTMTDYILGELKRVSEQITPRELAARALALALQAEREGHPRAYPDVAALIREGREEREKHLADLLTARDGGRIRTTKTRRSR